MSEDNNWLVAANGGGGRILAYDSFVGMEYDKAHALPEKPVEDGAFFTANKWALPYRATVTVAKTGEASEIRDFIDALEGLNGSTTLVSIVTPLRVLVDGTIEAIRYSFDNDDLGPRMVMPRISVKEVMFARKSTTTGKITAGNSKNAETGDTVEGGGTRTIPVDGMDAFA